MRTLNNKPRSSIFRRNNNKHDFLLLLLFFWSMLCAWLTLLDGIIAWEPMMTNFHRLMVEVDERRSFGGTMNGSSGAEFPRIMSDVNFPLNTQRSLSSGGRTPPTMKLPEANTTFSVFKQKSRALRRGASSRTWRPRTQNSILPARTGRERVGRTNTRERQLLPLSASSSHIRVLDKTLANNLPKMSHLLVQAHNGNHYGARSATHIHTYRHLRNRHNRHHYHRRRRRRGRRGVGRHHVDAPPPPISCFSCASAEYEALYAKANNLFTFGQPLQFDRSCDTRADLHNFAPAIRCDSTCITVLEPQFFGGLLNEKRPYSYVRGCSTDIFAVADAALLAATSSVSSELADYEDLPLPPPEIDILRRSETCVRMPIHRLWPELFSGSGTAVALGESSAEMVKVCSCRHSTCNTLDAADSGADSLIMHASFSIVHISLPTALLLFLGHRLVLRGGFL